jgi:hypothetical protein
VSSGLFFKKLCGGFGVHEGGPGLLGPVEEALRQASFGEPGVGFAARDDVEDQAHEVTGDRTGDTDGHVGFVALVGPDLDAQDESGEVSAVLAPVAQGSADQVADGVDQPTKQTGARFELVANPVLIAR